MDGLRVDHPDGLADPRGYLRRLAAATGGAWVVVEKILEAGEALPADWACAGTTGYDALRLVDGLFVDPEGGDAARARSTRGCAAGWATTPRPLRFADVAAEAKREIAAGSLRRRGDPAGPPGQRHLRRTRPRTTRAPCSPRCSPRSRSTAPTCTRASSPSAVATAAVCEARWMAARRPLPRRLRGLADELGAAALGTHRPVSGAAGRAGEFAVRFQQTTGPVQAKGVEDTAFYRWSRLISLNEVGGDPDRFGVPPEEFHAAAGRLAADWPATMTTLSTHDTKRQEDVRARLAVLAEMPPSGASRSGNGTSARCRRSRPGPADRRAAVDPDTEYLLWQTLVGAWPISGERLTGYLTKAIREAKRRTSWTDPDPELRGGGARPGRPRCSTSPSFAASIGAFVAAIAADALANSLGAKLVQLTMPGVPDVYQGCELAGLSLVDPDNRRPVDFARQPARGPGR